MADVQPKYVIALGTSGNPPTPSPFTLDAFGVLQVSVPQRVIGGIEVKTDIIDTSAGTIAAPKGLATAAILYGTDENGATIEKVLTGPTNADNLAGQATGNVMTIAQLFGWDGGNWDRIRVANVFKTAAVTAAGATAIWTPAAGKSFRLMGYSISVAGTLAATGPQVITLSDGATVIKNHVAELLQTVAATTGLQGQNFPCDLGQGQLSVAANNVLNINVGTAMATGNVSVNVWGTEE